MNSPHGKKSTRYSNIVNEWIVMVMFYNLLFLTDLAYNAFGTSARVAEAQLKFSNSFLIFLMVIFGGNVLLYFFNMAISAYEKNKLNNRRKEALDERREKYQERFERMLEKAKTGQLNNVFDKHQDLLKRLKAKKIQLKQ